MGMDLETHIFSAWYPAKDLIAESTTTRRVHKWFVNMMPNTDARYFVMVRNETDAERKEREENEDS